MGERWRWTAPSSTSPSLSKSWQPLRRAGSINKSVIRGVFCWRSFPVKPPARQLVSGKLSAISIPPESTGIQQVPHQPAGLGAVIFAADPEGQPATVPEEVDLLHPDPSLKELDLPDDHPLF